MTNTRQTRQILELVSQIEDLLLFYDSATYERLLKLLEPFGAEIGEMQRRADAEQVAAYERVMARVDVNRDQA